MKTTIRTCDQVEIHSPRFWETPPAPLPLPVICIGSLFIGGLVTALALINF